MEIVVATKNPHKLEEILDILVGLPFELRGAAAAGLPDVVEDLPTLEGNARKKASEAARRTGSFALADDTGLEVDALSGAPGVHSARYAGPGATYALNCEKLLGALAGVPAGRRTARFRCVIALCAPPAERFELTLCEGVLEGSIAEAPRGEHGFGYDPLFLVKDDPRGRTLAELTAREKNRISHRGRALAKLRETLEAIALGGEEIRPGDVRPVLLPPSPPSSASKTPS